MVERVYCQMRDSQITSAEGLVRSHSVYASPLNPTVEVHVKILDSQWITWIMDIDNWKYLQSYLDCTWTLKRRWGKLGDTSLSPFRIRQIFLDYLRMNLFTVTWRSYWCGFDYSISHCILLLSATDWFLPLKPSESRRRSANMAFSSCTRLRTDTSFSTHVLKTREEGCHL